jgi:cytochrome P450
MFRDEKRYPNPHAFDPSRWLTTSGDLDPNLAEPIAAFGFGRRFCPGKHIALSSVWITAASLLAGFSIQKALDDDGVPIQPNMKYHEESIRLV